ncbi:hypothetical protein B4135_2341 [Caldibacillus debilis]|uniref:Uncharacterized protein n=1 Tax=Caldibacillus debilis TaxID=301148 RepID=A0A150M2U7_9BACI|nr:hypothetical protein B4135_2341 [Caldibacillus debilis]
MREGHIAIKGEVNYSFFPRRRAGRPGKRRRILCPDPLLFF